MKRLALILVIASCSKAGSTSAAQCPAPDEKTGAIGWYTDDLAKATQCAADTHKPLVIDEWAPWCHSCLSMKTTVFTDPAFGAIADRYVWLAVDTDKDENAQVVAQYKPEAWPTYWVIDQAGTPPTIDAKFVGTTSVGQFRDFLAEGEKAFLAGAKLDPNSPEGHLVAAEKAMADANRTRTPEAYAAVVKEYQAALAAAPADWPRRPDVLVDTVGVMGRSGDPKACVDFAMQHLNETGKAASATDFLANAEGCADELAKTDPASATAFRNAAVARLEPEAADPSAPLSVDDRADTMINLSGLYTQLGRPDDSTKMLRAAQKLLDDAANEAADPLAASTYNWPRVEVYEALKEHEKLAPWLAKNAGDLPNQYDPPYRLAELYQDEGKLDDALTWAKKAVALAYGPRKARVQTVIGDILEQKGDTAGELAARQELVNIWKSLPAAQQNPDALAKAEGQVAALTAH